MGPAIDRVRGMADLPLSAVGHIQAEHLGARIAAKGGVSNIMSSPLLRTRQTASAILRHNRNSALFGATKGLLPWASGEFEGAPIHMVHDEMAHYIRNPSTPMPGVSQFSGVPGESLDQYWKGRLAPHVMSRMASIRPGEKALDITHYRDIRTVRSWIKAGAKPDLSIDQDELIRKDHTEPASMFRVTAGPRPSIEPVDLSNDSPLEPGYYMARHGSTEWSKESNTGEGLDPVRDTPHGRNILKHLGFGIRV